MLQSVKSLGPTELFNGLQSKKSYLLHDSFSSQSLLNNTSPKKLYAKHK